MFFQKQDAPILQNDMNSARDCYIRGSNFLLGKIP